MRKARYFSHNGLDSAIKEKFWDLCSSGCTRTNLPRWPFVAATVWPWTMNSSFKIEDDWNSSPFNLGDPSMVHQLEESKAKATAAAAAAPRKSSSPLKLTQRQRNAAAAAAASVDDEIKIYVEPTLYVQRILNQVTKKLSPVVELLPIEAHVLSVTSEVITPQLLAKEEKIRQLKEQQELEAQLQQQEAAESRPVAKRRISQEIDEDSQQPEVGRQRIQSPAPPPQTQQLPSQQQQQQQKQPKLQRRRRRSNSRPPSQPAAAAVSQQPIFSQSSSANPPIAAQSSHPQDLVLVRLSGGQLLKVPKALLQKVPGIGAAAAATASTATQPARLPAPPQPARLPPVPRANLPPPPPPTTTVQQLIVRQPLPPLPHLHPPQLQQLRFIAPMIPPPLPITPLPMAKTQPADQPKPMPPPPLAAQLPLVPPPLPQIKTIVKTPAASQAVAGAIPMQGKLSDVLTKLSTDGSCYDVTAAAAGGHNQVILNGIMRKLAESKQASNGKSQVRAVKIRAFQGQKDNSSVLPNSNEFGIGKLNDQFAKVSQKIAPSSVIGRGDSLNPRSAAAGAAATPGGGGGTIRVIIPPSISVSVKAPTKNLVLAPPLPPLPTSTVTSVAGAKKAAPSPTLLKTLIKTPVQLPSGSAATKLGPLTSPIKHTNGEIAGSHKVATAQTVSRVFLPNSSPDFKPQLHLTSMPSTAATAPAGVCRPPLLGAAAVTSTICQPSIVRPTAGVVANTSISSPVKTAVASEAAKPVTMLVPAVSATGAVTAALAAAAATSAATSAESPSTTAKLNGEVEVCSTRNEA